MEQSLSTGIRLAIHQGHGMKDIVRCVREVRTGQVRQVAVSKRTWM